MAAVVLNDKFLSALKPPADGGRREIIDAGFGCKGGSFVCRVSSGGAVSFCLRYRPKDGGPQRRYLVGSYPPLTLAKAREAARKVLAQVQLGEDPQKQRRVSQQGMTFGALFKEYMNQHGAKKRTGGRDQELADRDLLPKWKARKAEGIEAADINAVLDAIVGRGAPIAANRTRSLILKIFAFAVARGYLKQNPCAAVPKPAPENKRDRVLAKDSELRALWKQFDKADALTGAAMKLLLLTAARHGEVLGMKWADVDFRSAVWTVPAEEAKNGKAHALPLSRQALDLLEGLKPVSGNGVYVFPAARGDGHMAYLHKPFDTMTAAAKIKGLRPHDLRRTAATRLSEGGCPREVLKRILNHTGTDVTDVYDRAKLLKPARAALQKLADGIDRAVAVKDAEQENVVPLRA